MDFLTRTVVLFLISCTAISLQNVQNTRTKNSDSGYTLRDKRGFAVKTKPGPLRQIFSIIFEQWNDTKHTMRNINTLLNDQFIPENPPPTTTTTPNPNLNISTKPPPFKIKRSEFIKIINRNLRGIGRLYNLELQDAIKASEITRKEFSRNVSREVSKFL